MPPSPPRPAPPPAPGGLLLRPIGTFRSVFTTKNGAPRQGALAACSRGVLQLSDSGSKNSHGHGGGSHAGQRLRGMEDYSHAWLIFLFHDNSGTHTPHTLACTTTTDQRSAEGEEEEVLDVHSGAVRSLVRPPRLNGGKVGLYATRTPHRPNPVGLTLARIERVDPIRGRLHVSHVDLIDGTPVLDIKPYIPAYDSHQDARVPHWVTSPYGGGVERSRVVRVQWTERAQGQLRHYVEGGALRLFSPDEAQQVQRLVEEVLTEDPRSTYRRKKCGPDPYWFHVDDLNIEVRFVPLPQESNTAGEEATQPSDPTASVSASTITSANITNTDARRDYSNVDVKAVIQGMDLWPGGRPPAGTQPADLNSA